MKSYMVSLLVIGIALGGLGLGTFAYYTDSHTVYNNIIKTGTTDLGLEITNADGTQNKLNVSGLAPAEWQTAGYIILTNDGTTNLKWKGYLNKTSGTLPTEQLKVKFTIRPAGSDSMIPDGYTAWSTDVGTEKVYFWDQVSVFDSSYLYSYNFKDNEMAPKKCMVIKVDLGLTGDADNDYMNKYAYFKAVFNATQSVNSGWTE